MYVILVRPREGEEYEVGCGLEEQNALHLFFTLHNAVNVSRDPAPLVVASDDGNDVFVYPQDVSSLRLTEDGLDVTGRMLVGG